MNLVASYLSEHYDDLQLERFDVPREPTCLLLTPRFRLSRHIVGLVLDASGERATLVAKVPRLAGDGAALAREARALRAAGRTLAGSDAGTAPLLVAFADDGPYPLLLETALPGEPLSPAVIRRDRDHAVADVVAWLVRLGQASATYAPDDAWYEELVVEPLRELADAGGRDSEIRTLVERTLALAEPMRTQRPPLVLVHGDLSHPNLLRQPDGRLGVLDWERGELAGLPGHDLFFFLAYAGMASRRSRDDRGGGRLAGVKAAFAGADAWAWPVALEYADRLGLDAELLPTLLAVCSARAVAGAGGPWGRQPTGRDAVARHMLLWRLALDELPSPLDVTLGAQRA